ncbi:AAA family ATPase, partial [Aeromicrobium sp.]|uniref:ATP-dependent DNA helicase n=1 Tax=Aeromicrobium sp. TaxID=1871063 RepID=UPI0019910605
IELAEDLTARTLERCKPLLARLDVPEHIRALTSPRVLAVEAELTARLTERVTNDHPDTVIAAASGIPPEGGLDVAQRHVAAQLAGQAGLLVVEGAAGAGKTVTLAAAHQALQQQGYGRMVVVTPTLKAASVATHELGTEAFSAAWLAHQHGFRWDDDGRWTRVPAVAEPRARLAPGDLLVVDEAGMLDQDTALALVKIADQAGARLALVGDRRQLPAVGRGGVLDLAAGVAPEESCLTLETVHRFADADYADLTLAMRTGQNPAEVFEALLARGDIQIHLSDTERLHHLVNVAGTGADDTQPGRTLVVADTREQVAALNAAIGEHRFASQGDAARGAIFTSAGERVGVGDTIATRRNDRTLGVANRETWTVTGLADDASLTVIREGGISATAGPGTQGGTQPGPRPGMRAKPQVSRGERTLPAAYVRAHVELGYARTVYGAQGETVDRAHFVLGEQTGAASAYVAMTRGRTTNTAHLVADTIDQARQQWVGVFSRDRADLGPARAATRAAEDLDRYGGLDWETASALETTNEADNRRQHQRDEHHERVPEPGRGGPSR